ncbi:hypothetical protein PInf_015882 [Phytophthora infestans]|nr:hypothetical protein PInf_015882 [Phytophthora infestans]
MKEPSFSKKTVVIEVTTKAQTEKKSREFVKIAMPRFSGGSPQVGESFQAPTSNPHLRLVLGNEVLELWRTLTDKKAMAKDDVFNAAFAEWGRLFVSWTCHAQLEEDLHMFAKRRSETVARCRQRFRDITRMLNNIPLSAI